jgi:hypothetical protein
VRGTALKRWLCLFGVTGYAVVLVSLLAFDVLLRTQGPLPQLSEDMTRAEVEAALG